MFKHNLIRAAAIVILVTLGALVFLNVATVTASEVEGTKSQTARSFSPNTVPSSPLGDWVVDNVIPYRATVWKPAANAERWWPNTQKQGNLIGLKLPDAVSGGNWIRARASKIRWSQASLNWILGNNSNPTKRVEVLFHSFAQDTNNCISTFTTDTSDLIESDLPGWDPFSKAACFPFIGDHNEARIVITRPQDIVAGQSYFADAWFLDELPLDLGEIPHAFGWQTENHANIDPDDNLKKICFGADTGKSWGQNVLANFGCRDAAPVTLFSSQNFGGTIEGFTGNDHWLPDNPIGNDNTRSLKVKGGWEARLYTHSNYGLPEEIFGNDDTDLTNNAIGSGASSVKAIANGVALYRDQNFMGVSQVFGNGCDMDLSNNAIGNDTITSVRVPPGWKLELYEHPNKGGKKLVFQGINDVNIYDNKAFNDITSSLCVYTPAAQEANGEFGDWTGDDGD